MYHLYFFILGSSRTARQAGSIAEGTEGSRRKTSSSI